MANYAWRAVRARCPFYKKSFDLTITCSWADTADDGNVRRKFRDPAACDDYFRRHCAMHYTRCPIYRLIEEIMEGDT